MCTEKVMLTIFWNPNGFHVINILPNGIKFNINYYITDILVLLLEWRKTQVGESDRKVIVHADNAGPRAVRVTLGFLKHNRMKRALHPSCSPALVSSDFSLLSLWVRQATLGRTRIP
jgi:hypothetical protein